MQTQLRRRSGRGPRRGFTLAETTVAVGVFALVMTGVAAIFLLSAKTISELYGPIRSRSARTIALNQIRFRLSDASRGSCTFYAADGYRRIRFKDPNLAGGPVSEFNFNPDEKALYYDKNVGDSEPPVKIARGPIEITFKDGSGGIGLDALVTLYVQTSSDLAYSKVDKREGETVVYLRNPSS